MSISHYFQLVTHNFTIIYRPLQDFSVISMSATYVVGCGFVPLPGHSKNHHKNGKNYPPSWHAGIRVEVWQCSLTVRMAR